MQFQEHQFTLRDPTTHKDHCKLVKGPSGSAYSKEYGVNSESVLDSLSYVRVTSGILLPDIMHDLLEGAVQYEIKLMLRIFILHEHYFTLDEMNDKLRRTWSCVYGEQGPANSHC